MRFLTFICLGMLSWALPASGTITVGPWSPLYRGIDLATGTADASEPRIQKVFTIRVDLEDPTIEFFSTPSNEERPLDTDGQTTTTFVERYGVQVGMNANFFTPVTTILDDPRDLRGLAISRGVLISPHTSSYPPALFTRSNQVTFVNAPPADLGNFWTAVSGSDLILINGVAQLQSCTTDFCNENPRSALGLSQDGRYLYMMVIDGRQPNWSAGATLYETGEWLARFGAWEGLNLDGGGSTALACATNGTAVLLNRPSGGTQRINGNHLGVFAHPLGLNVWNGGGANNNWSNAANWYNKLPSPGTNCDLVFEGKSRLAAYNNFPPLSDFGQITFGTNAGPFSLFGNGIRPYGGIVNYSTNAQSLNLPLNLATSLLAQPAVGDLAFGGALSGTGGLIAAGPGTIILSGDESFTGLLSVTGGLLWSIGTLVNAGGIAVNGGTLAVGGGVTGSGAWRTGGSPQTNGLTRIEPGAAIEVSGIFDAGTVATANAGVRIKGGTFTNSAASNAQNFRIGSSGYANLRMTGGQVQVNTFYVGGGSGVATAEIAGGTFLAGRPGTADYLLVGGVSGGTGVLTIEAGLLSHANANRLLSINNNSDGRGELNILGGELDNSGTGIGYGYNTGTGTGSGIVNLNGGKLTLNRFVNTKQSGLPNPTATGASYLNFNGGTLAASASTLTSPTLSLSSNLIPARIVTCVYGSFESFSGGATIDTAGQNCIVEPGLQAPAGSGISGLNVSEGGSGYVGTPYVSIQGDGTAATAIAVMEDDATGKGTLRVAKVKVTNPGINYSAGVTSFSFEGGGAKIPATPGTVITRPNVSGGLVKTGAGMLTLRGVNTYTGPTVVSLGTLNVEGSLATGSRVTVPGTLAGSGVIGGPVTIESGGTLAPGGTLTVSNTLTFNPGSSAVMHVNAGSGNSDLVRGLSSVFYGGTLSVSNTAGQFAAGQSFRLFDAAASSGNFEAVVPALAEGLAWYFNPADGTLRVVTASPTRLTHSISGRLLTLSWPGTYLGWCAQSNSVSLANPDAWFPIPGSQVVTSLSIEIGASHSPVYYRLIRE